MIKKALIEKRNNIRKYILLKDGIKVTIELHKLSLSKFGSSWGCYSESILNREFILYIESLLRGLNEKNKQENN